MFVIHITLNLQKRPKQTIKHLETPSQTDLRLRHPTPLSPSTPQTSPTLVRPRGLGRGWPPAKGLRIRPCADRAVSVRRGRFVDIDPPCLYFFLGGALEVFGQKVHIIQHIFQARSSELDPSSIGIGPFDPLFWVTRQVHRCHPT